MVIRKADGYCRCTRALATRRIVATRSATCWVSICSNGVAGRTLAASRTSSRLTAPIPMITISRADIAGVKYSASPSPIPTTASTTVASSAFSPRTTPRAAGLAGFCSLTICPRARRLAARRACSIAVARACAARRSARSRRARRRGPSNSGCSAGSSFDSVANGSVTASSSAASSATRSICGSSLCSVIPAPPDGRGRFGWPGPEGRSGFPGPARSRLRHPS
ncbi:Uncharacterised protein [Mycobacterium tuberculosis]|nr:Uncharacterised protein [Mycobacterium tuberculosis]